MEDRLKSKLLKLYELAKKGVDGEKINAELLLNKMLQKHNLTIENIIQEKPKERGYKYTTSLNKTLLVQIIFNVTKRSEIYGVRKSREVFSSVTDYEHIQILELLDFHLDNFNLEKKQLLNDFINAYVQKHKLYRDLPDSELKEDKPLTKEEEQAIWRMSNIKDILSNRSYTKKLSQ